MVELSNKKRQEIEALIYKTFETLDKSKTNVEYYKEKFSKMSNDDFLKFISQKFPYRFHEKPFVTEPTMSDIKKACDVIGVPLLEKINMPYLYENKDGIPVSSQECLVVYVPLKKVKQFITKKNSMSVDISQRDMRTGLLTWYDKNGKTSDREMESLATLGLEKTMLELSRPRADSMKSKNQMYNEINTKGQVSLSELDISHDDSLAKNMLNTYLLGSMINSNIINQDYYLPITLKDKKKSLEKK